MGCHHGSNHDVACISKAFRNGCQCGPSGKNIINNHHPTGMAQVGNPVIACASLHSLPSSSVRHRVMPQASKTAMGDRAVHPGAGVVPAQRPSQKQSGGIPAIYSSTP